MSMRVFKWVETTNFDGKSGISSTMLRYRWSVLGATFAWEGRLRICPRLPRYQAAGSVKNKVVITTTKIPARKFELAFCSWFLGKRWQGSRIPLFTSLCSLDFELILMIYISYRTKNRILRDKYLFFTYLYSISIKVLSLKIFSLPTFFS